MAMVRYQTRVFRQVAADEHWVLQTAISDRVLVGDAADSPIVRSKNQASVVTAIGYRF
jgi:outer membrane scaffolding protein for murein synthesis (MipA/OmpV family)